MKYLLNKPSISSLEIKYVNDVLKKGWLSAEGEHTLVFEKKFLKYIGLKYGLAVQSGTAALHAALKALDVKVGDRVIIPNYTCLSNISAVKQCGALPVIVEVERDTLGLDYELLKKAVTRYKPKVVQLVHVYGYPARDTLKISKLCKLKKIKLLEDTSESLGSKIFEKRTGTFGDINITSLRSEKMIGVGEGGFISTNNKVLFEKSYLYAARNAKYRKNTDPYWKKYFAQGEGCNYRLPHLLGAFGRGQIERFSGYLLKNKILVGKMYRKVFKNSEYFFLQKIVKGSKPNYWLNAIYFKDFNFKKTIKVGNFLMKSGVEIRSGFWPMSKQSGFDFKIVKKDNVSQDVFNKTIVLPSSYDLKLKDIINIKKKLDRAIY
jgi:dTDP-4-amino-4,6-dideoxygalactose transaminase